MTELEILQRAKEYTDKMANGINPLNDEAIPETDILNNIRLSRCLFYVSDVLRRVIENGGTVGSKKTPKENFNISFEQIQRFEYSDTPIPVSEIAKRINALTENADMKKISHKHITDWLISLQLLYVETMPDGKTAKRPTESGGELGITTEVRNGMYGNYTIVVYNRSAQQFVIDNIDAIVSMMYGRE